MDSDDSRADSTDNENSFKSDKSNGSVSDGSESTGSEAPSDSKRPGNDDPIESPEPTGGVGAVDDEEGDAVNSPRSASKSPNSPRKSAENSSDSSDSSSSDESCNRKNISRNVQDVQPEEISDGDIVPSPEPTSPSKSKAAQQIGDINISHEDLSDVSDLEDSIGAHSDNEQASCMTTENNRNNAEVDKTNNATNKSEAPAAEEGEEQLDFEAEDGECGEIESDNKVNDDHKETLEEGETMDSAKGERTEESPPTPSSSSTSKKKEDLEEGEVSDEDDVRPEETEPRPVCRFFSRGQCTWGASCRFLHPGVTDKGNYTMFEMVRPLVPGGGAGEFGSDRYGGVGGRLEPPPVESAWERGLRTAKEMLRKSVKRKEQDIDFEEKKMNLSLAQEEFDKENGYYGRVTSPEPRYVRHQVEYPPLVPPPSRQAPEEYYSSHRHRQVIYEPPDYIAAPSGREQQRSRPSYRELPTHKMPDYYNAKYEEEEEAAAAAAAAAAVKRKPKREVIVQRVEREREEHPAVRGDEWSDPWMRSKSPKRSGGGGGGRKRSYSSGSSYSSSSSTHSSSSRSSYKSRSRSNSRRRVDGGKSRAKKPRRAVSPSVIVSERKAANERAAMMNPPAPKKRAPSPGMLRAVSAANPPAPSIDQFGRTRSKLAVAAAIARARGRRKSSRSSSDSSGSSSSDSDSSNSSSSSSREPSPQPPKRDVGAPRRTTEKKALKSVSDVSLVKAMDALKSSNKRQSIKMNLKASLSGHKAELADLVKKTSEQQQAKKRQSSPPPSSANNNSSSNNDAKNKKAASRREELLKQLKAVEDAIAKKRSKVN